MCSLHLQVTVFVYTHIYFLRAILKEIENDKSKKKKKRKRKNEEIRNGKRKERR